MSVLNNIFITMRTNLAQLVGRDENDGMHDGGSGAPLIENGGGNQQRGFVPSYGAVEFTDVQMVEGMSGRGWTTKLRPQPQQNLWTSGRKKMALVFSLCAFACLLVGYGGFGGFFPSGEGAPSTFLEMHAFHQIQKILNGRGSTTEEELAEEPLCQRGLYKKKKDANKWAYLGKDIHVWKEHEDYWSLPTFNFVVGQGSETQCEQNPDESRFWCDERGTLRHGRSSFADEYVFLDAAAPAELKRIVVPRKLEGIMTNIKASDELKQYTSEESEACRNDLGCLEELLLKTTALGVVVQMKADEKTEWHEKTQEGKKEWLKGNFVVEGDPDNLVNEVTLQLAKKAAIKDLPQTLVDPTQAQTLVVPKTEQQLRLDYSELVQKQAGLATNKVHLTPTPGVVDDIDAFVPGTEKAEGGDQLVNRSHAKSKDEKSSETPKRKPWTNYYSKGGPLTKRK